MNRSHLATLALLLALVLPSAAWGQLCTSPCKVLILPDLKQVPLNLDGWMVPTGTALADITMLESPKLGLYNPSTQIYEPVPDFWNVGMDRLVISTPATGRRVLLLATASPLVHHEHKEDFDGGAIGTWTVSGATSYSFTSSASGYALHLQGAAGQTSTYIPPGDSTGRPTIAQGLGSGVGPMPPAPYGLVDSEVVVQSIPGVLEVQVKTEEGKHYVRAKAVHPGFGCGGAVVCETPYQPIPSGVFTRVETVIGPPTDGGSPNVKFSLRFNVTTPGNPTVHFELGNLNPISISGGFAAAFGMAGTNLAGATIEIDDAEAFSLQQSLEDEEIVARADGFDASGVGYEAVWTVDGMLSFATLAGSQWLEADLRKLTPASLSTRNSVVDTLATNRKRMRLTVQLDLSGLNLADNDNLTIFAASGPNTLPATNRVVELLIRRVAGDYQLRGRAFTETGSVATTAWLSLDAFAPLAGPPNNVSLDWSAATGPTATDGYLRLKLNHQYSAASGIANGGRLFNSLSFGPCLVNVATPNPTFGARVLHYENIGTIY